MLRSSNTATQAALWMAYNLVCLCLAACMDTDLLLADGAAPSADCDTILQITHANPLGIDPLLRLHKLYIEYKARVAIPGYYHASLLVYDNSTRTWKYYHGPIQKTVHFATTELTLCDMEALYCPYKFYMLLHSPVENSSHRICSEQFVIGENGVVFYPGQVVPLPCSNKLGYYI